MNFGVFYLSPFEFHTSLENVADIYTLKIFIVFGKKELFNGLFNIQLKGYLTI